MISFYALKYMSKKCNFSLWRYVLGGFRSWPAYIFSDIFLEIKKKKQNMKAHRVTDFQIPFFFFSVGELYR